MFTKRDVIVNKQVLIAAWFVDSWLGINKQTKTRVSSSDGLFDCVEVRRQKAAKLVAAVVIVLLEADGLISTNLSWTP